MSTSGRYAVTPRPALPAVPAPVIFVDSDIYVDLITRNNEPHNDTGEERWRSAKTLFDAINTNRARLACSALVEAEVCCNGESRKGSERVSELLRRWFNSPSTLWTDVDRFLARDAAKLAAQYSQLRASSGSRGLRGADATHMAAAIRLGCDYLMTHDQGFPIGHTIEGVQVSRPTVVWPATLLDELEDHSIEPSQRGAE